MIWTPWDRNYNDFRDKLASSNISLCDVWHTSVVYPVKYLIGCGGPPSLFQQGEISFQSVIALTAAKMLTVRSVKCIVGGSIEKSTKQIISYIVLDRLLIGDRASWWPWRPHLQVEGSALIDAIERQISWLKQWPRSVTTWKQSTSPCGISCILSVSSICITRAVAIMCCAKRHRLSEGWWW